MILNLAADGVTVHINKINSEKLLKPNLKLLFCCCILYLEQCAGHGIDPRCNLPRESQSDAFIISSAMAASLQPNCTNYSDRRPRTHLPFRAFTLCLRPCVSFSPNFLTGRVVFFCEVVNKEIWCDDDRCTGTVR